MATIVTRASKGSALTWQEGDANITNLNDDKLENINNESIGDLSDVDLTSISVGDVLVWDSSKFIAGQASGGGIAKLEDDTAPKLGGDLDTNGKNIQNLNGQLSISASGPVTVTSTDSLAISSNSTMNLVAANGDLSLQTTGNISLESYGSTGNITLTPGAAGKIVANKLNYSETIHNLGVTDGPILDVANGNVQTVTFTITLALDQFQNSQPGQSITLLVTGTGTAVGATGYRFAGGETTLTGFSVVSIFYDGTNYWASISKDFQ